MPGTIAAQLARHFPEAHIVFTIRSQFDAIESYYGNHRRILKNVPAPFAGNFVNFENWLEYSWANWSKYFLGLCDYHRAIDLYRRLFGANQVHLLPFGRRLRQLSHLILRGGRSYEVFISPAWKDRLRTAYALGIKQMAIDFGLPLAGYRYPLGDETDNVSYHLKQVPTPSSNN